MATTNQEAGQSVHQQLNFYVLSLNFTVLGFSLQTAKFGMSLISDSIELIAWLAFLVSGLACIKKLEGMAFIYNAVATLPNPNTSDAKDALGHWQLRLVGLPHRVHVYSFYFGMFALVIARAWLPILGIFERAYSGK